MVSETSGTSLERSVTRALPIRTITCLERKMKIQFLGATGMVTGSRYLVSHEENQILIDCGLFQGVKRLRERNWEALAVTPSKLNAVVLTHAHLDHSGYLPRLVKAGFKGPIYCSAATRELVKILLLDSGNLQEADAERANRYGYSKHRPALPLYTAQDAEDVFPLLEAKPFHESFRVGRLAISLKPVGHILGASSIRISAAGRSLTFTGDVGRPHDPIMKAPEPLDETDFLVIESTYGDRLHEQADTSEQLAEIARATLSRGGTLMIPAFAVGRAQSMMHLLASLQKKHEIPRAQIFLDSPMAIDVSDIFCDHAAEHRLSNLQCREMCQAVNYVRDVEGSKKLSQDPRPKIIIAGAGMLSGGRILHHLLAFGGDHRNTLLLAGYQAEGTRGRALLDGKKTLRIYGQDANINCHTEVLHGLSGHADYQELGNWLSSLPRAPSRVFVTHGEQGASASFQQYLRAKFGWNVELPEDQGEITLF